ncbi:MAG: hypothetical protein ACXW0L_05610 [Methylosarcina sp.]
MNNMLHPPKQGLKVALLGMDERTKKILTMYLQGPCKEAGVIVVDDGHAEVDIIDIDLPGGKIILNRKRDNGSELPSIALSLRDANSISSDSIFYIKKPVTHDALLNALDQSKKYISSRSNKISRNSPDTEAGLPDESSSENVQREIINEPDHSPALKHYAADISDRDKKSKHKTAMQMDEKSFALYMGIMTSLDIANPAQLKQAFYNPQDYFQGYVQSAYKIALAKGRVVELISGWKQLLIFPHSDEVWLDADDKQLRVFAGLAINNNGINTNMSVRPLDPKTVLNRDLEKFQSMDALAWKLACWTSKGRYPQQIDIDQPVYLKHWPNFTRLLITPHALRIAALLVDRPRTATHIADILKIKPEYVFIFISSASAIGLLGQAAKNANIAVAHSAPQSDKKHSFFSRIISKLRANKD